MINNVQTNLDTPEYAVPQDNRIPVDDYIGRMKAIPPSRMFTIKEALRIYYSNNPGQEAYDASQGDGGASLPGVPRYLLERAAELQIEHGTGYDKPFGTPLFRDVTAEKYWGIKPETGWGPENIIFAQGGRDALPKAFKAMLALGHKRMGDVLVVSRVPWISYNWTPYSVGMNVLRAPGHPEESWRYTADSILASKEYAAREGRKVSGLLITSPDNPTGRTMPVSEQIELARTAIEAGYPFVVFDWIYHYITDGQPSDINEVLLAFDAEDRKKLIFLDGITKSLGASNIRSAHLVADTSIIKHINSEASHGVIPSFYAQAVAIAAYEEGFATAAKTIIEPCSASRKVLGQALKDNGFKYVIGDGYYAFIELEDYIRAGNFTDSADLGAYLAEEHGVAIVPGVYFGPAAAMWARFSYALPPERTQATFDRLLEGLNAAKTRS